MKTIIVKKRDFSIWGKGGGVGWSQGIQDFPLSALI